MAREDEDSFWLTNISNQLNNLCWIRSDIMPPLQEPIEYVRTQIVTAGDSFVQLCTELMGCMRPVCSTVEVSPMNSTQEANTDLPNDVAADSDAVKFSSPPSTDEPTMNPTQEANTDLPNDEAAESDAVKFSSPPSTDEPLMNPTQEANTDLPNDEAAESDAAKFSSPSLTDEPLGNICMDNSATDETILSSKSQVSDTLPEQDKMGNTVGVVEEVGSDAHSNLSASVQSSVTEPCGKTEEVTDFTLWSSLDDDVVQYNRTVFRQQAFYFRRETINPNYSPECIDDGEAQDCRVASRGDPEDIESSLDSELSDEYVSVGDKSDFDDVSEPDETDVLDQSTIVVDMSDYDEENETTLDEKIDNEFSCETVSEDIDVKTAEETGDCAKEAVTSDEDFVDSEWELI